MCYLMFVDPCILVLFIKKIQQDATVFQNFFIIPNLYEAQHVSGDTAHHQEPKTALAASGFYHTWKVVGRCQAHCA
jgi:hypothetical protein